MYKKIFFILAAFLLFALSFSYGATKPGREVIIKTKSIDGSTAKINSLNVIYYVWVLMDNGCYYLFRVEVVGGILEFWTPMGPHNFIGSTVNCFYLEQIDSIC